MRSAQDEQESPAEREMRKQIGELEKLLRDQQALRDDTFRSDQKDRARKRAQRNQSSPDQQDSRGNRPGWFERSRTERQRFRPGRQAGPGSGGTRPNRSSAIASKSCATVLPKCSVNSRLGMKGEKGFDDAQGDMEETEATSKAAKAKKSGQGGQGGEGAAVDAQGRALRRCAIARRGCRSRWIAWSGKVKGKGGKDVCLAQEPTGGKARRRPAGRGRKARRDARRAARAVGSRRQRARRLIEELRRRLADPTVR